MNELEQHVFAFYVQGAGKDLVIAPRFYPHGELILIVEDKIQVAARAFGFKVTSKAKAAAAAFVDLMIAREAFSTKKNDFGGTMHQFQEGAYKAVLRELQATDPIIQQAKAGGDGFWTDAFAGLTS